MTYEIQILDGSDEELIFSLATSNGWWLVSEWALSLPKETFPALIEFANVGKYTGTDTLAQQYQDALEQHPPAHNAVADTVKHLLTLLGVGDPDESVIVIDSDSEDDEDDDDDDSSDEPAAPIEAVAKPRPRLRHAPKLRQQPKSPKRKPPKR